MVNNIGRLLLVAGLVLLGGCDNSADIARPSSYQKNGITFSYPGNWDITGEDANGAMRFVIVEGPGNGLFLTQVYPKEQAVSLEEFAKWFSAEAARSTPFGTIETISYTNIDKSFGTRTLSGIKEEFAVIVLGQRVPHMREYFSIESGERVAFMVGQSTRDNQRAVQPGLDLIMGTFATRLPAAKEGARVR